MRPLPKFLFAACFVVSGCLTVQAQVSNYVYPVPIPGGDIFLAGPSQQQVFLNQFFPGIGAGFDEVNADPHGITNFSGIVAMGYTSGKATDSAGHTYNIATDIRVYQGTYVGAQAHQGAGGSISAKAHGTFVEI
jgi:hypothetical protein